MSIADKLQTIQTIKDDIKTAINNKGGNVGDDFTEYADAIDNLPTGGGITKISVKDSGIKFANSKFSELPEYYDFEGITDMSYMFHSCLSLTTIPQLDTSNVTDMSYMFYNCSKLTTIPQLDTSNVVSMERMFYNCKKLATIPQLDTSNVINMSYAFANCDSLTSIPPLNAEKLTSNTIFGGNDLSYLTDFGGLIGLNCNLNGSYAFNKCPNLTYQSCINILNGLADVTELGGRTLKVHSNFLTLVGDSISIGTNKGWIITA